MSSRLNGVRFPFGRRSVAFGSKSDRDVLDYFVIELIEPEAIIAVVVVVRGDGVKPAPARVA